MRKVLVGTLIGLAAALAVRLLGSTAFFQTIELKTYDWRVARTANPATARQDIVLVSIDNASIRSLEPHVGRWPWPRLVHAHLIDYLARAPARLIVYDVLFSERDVKSFKLGEETWTGKESDDALLRDDAEPEPWIPDEEATGTINYTSGTTARPKGVQLTHRSLWVNATTFGWQTGVSDRDVYLRSLNAPFLFRSCSTISTALLPRFLMAPNPKRMEGLP